MQFYKYSLFLLLISSLAYAGKFDSKQCLESKFNTSIKHEGKFFGLIKNDLVLKKEGCLLDIYFKNILETTWKIDICRTPIHLKVKSKGTESFYKRSTNCSGSTRDEFCDYWADLKETLQDYGLIFAKGQREDLETPHGQVYCSYLLLERYLGDGVLFSKFEAPKSIFEKAQIKPKKEVKPKLVVPSSPGIAPRFPTKNIQDPEDDSQAVDLLEGARSAVNDAKENDQNDEDKPRF